MFVLSYTNVEMGLCVFVKGGGVYTNLGMGLCVFVRGVVCGNVL